MFALRKRYVGDFGLGVSCRCTSVVAVPRYFFLQVWGHITNVASVCCLYVIGLKTSHCLYTRYKFTVQSLELKSLSFASRRRHQQRSTRVATLQEVARQVTKQLRGHLQ